MLEWAAISFSKVSWWPRIKLASLVSTALAGGFYTTWTTWKLFNPRHTQLILAILDISWQPQALSVVSEIVPSTKYTQDVLSKQKMKVDQSCPTLCNHMNSRWNSLGQNTGVGRLSSQPRGQTQVSCIAGIFFTSWAIREAWTNKQNRRQILCGPPGSRSRNIWPSKFIIPTFKY